MLSSLFLSCLLIVTGSAQQEVTNYDLASTTASSTSATAFTNNITPVASLTDGQIFATTAGTADGSNPNDLSPNPSLTGTALSAADSAYLAANTPLTGKALSAAISDYLAASPSLTGTAASAVSAAIASEQNYYATAAGSIHPTTYSTSPDACGPKILDPSVPDSCDTPVTFSDQPTAYGVQCLNDTSTSTPINITSCASLIPQLCSNQWQSPDEWVWLTANDCSIGSLLPGSDFPGHAFYPNASACEELIYASMVDTCEFNAQPYNIAAVNLKYLPNDEGDGTHSGAAVNVGYGSYVVAARQLRTLSDKKDCTWVPPDDYCQGNCYPPSYYQSKLRKPTPCGALSSPAAVSTTLGA